MAHNNGFVGTCSAMRTEIRNVNSKHAIYVRVFVTDESGKEFYYDTAAFYFDLRAAEPSQPEGKQ